MKIGSCGMGVTPYGYYPCAVAGGIDRIFGFNHYSSSQSSLDCQNGNLSRLFRVGARADQDLYVLIQGGEKFHQPFN